METFFSPRGIAVIGASRDPSRLGSLVLQNLLAAGYSGPIWPVNPSAEEIMGRPAAASLSEVPEPVEMVVLALRAEALPDFLTDLEKRMAIRGDVRALVAIGAGFLEDGTPEGAERQERLKATCRRLGIRLLGPNCIGVINTRTGVDTTFLSDPHRHKGGVSLATQSGALVAWLYGLWAGEPAAPGLAKVVSTGNAADVDLAEAVEYLAQDPETTCAGIYVEGTTQARRLLQSISEAAAQKPVVVLKGGRSAAGEAAAFSHTGSMAGAGALWEGALKQAGALQATTTEEFSVMLAAGERLWPYLAGISGPALRLALLTNAGGPGVLASDALFGHVRGQKPVLVPAVFDSLTREMLTASLPRGAACGRPDGYVDTTAAAGPREQAAALSIALRDPNVDAAYMIALPTPASPADAVADAILGALAEIPPEAARKPVMIIMAAGQHQAAGRQILTEAGRPVFASVNEAARALRALAEYRQWRAAQGWSRPWREVSA